MISDWYSLKKSGETTLWVLVSTQQNKTCVKEVFQDTDRFRLKVSLKSPPVDGKANEELISFISKKLRIAKKMISITSGESSKRKTLQLNAFYTAEELQQILLT